MSNSFIKYAAYINRFIKSKNKKAVLKDLISDIRNKGIKTGTQSLLHKKSPLYLEEQRAIYDFFLTTPFSVKKYDKTIKRSLPFVQNPIVTIIIPSHNQIDYTFDCICSIIENNTFNSYEVIIADDNSTEDIFQLEASFEHLIINKNETNFGFLKNCNKAAALAKGKYIVFLNNDTQVQKDWLQELLFIFDSDNKAGLAGSMLIYPDGSLQEAGGIIWKDGSGHNYGNGDDPAKPQYNYVKEADYISGASIMILKQLWDEIGGFDERYLPAYCEDSDLCFEVRNRGYKVVYQPFSRVVHFEGISHGTDLGTGVKKYQIINQKKLFQKWQSVLESKSKKDEHLFSERDRTTDKKHVLVVDHYLPQVDKDAGSRTISNFIDALQGLGYSVKFLGENDNSSPHYRKQFQLKGVEVLYGREFNFPKQNWRYYLNRNMQQLDAILLSRSSVCTPILSFLRNKRYKGNIIYYGHDLGYLRVEREAKVKNDATLYEEAKKIKAKEDYMYKHVTNALGISSEEMEYLRKYIKTPLHYVPPYFFDVAKNTTSFEARSGLLFVGGFSHSPNRDAMQWFLGELYPELDRQGIPLTIAGSEMPAFIYESQQRYKLLSVLPDVSIEKLNDLYTQTRIAIVPLTNGAGVKGKVIEAMAKGVPVAGTDVAFEGMPKDDYYLYKGYNMPQSLTENIIALYSNKAEWEKLSNFGKKYVSEHFNKERMQQVFKELIESQPKKAK